MIRTTLCVILLFGGQGVSADACYSQQQGWTSDNRHQPLEPKPLTREEFRALESTFRALRKLQRNVSGTEHGFICKGSEKTPRKSVSRSTLEGTVSAGHEDFTLSVELDSKRKTRSEKFSLHLDRAYLTTPIRSKVEILSAATGQIKYRERSGGRNQSGGRIILERLVNLKIQDNVLTIEFKVYAQGQLSSQSTWRVTRRN